MSPKQEQSFPEQLNQYRTAIEEALDNALALTPCRYQTVIEAMRYSLLGAGKRIRAVLVLEFARIFGVMPEHAMPVACAIEMIHAYSLIHDDLPCMDDDAFRRGKPSCHVQFGEAAALLAGDGLLTCAFETAGQAAQNLPSEGVLAAMEKMAQCAGYRGMIGGQVIDLESEGKSISPQALEEMYRLKTGALLEASCSCGCLLAGKQEMVVTAENYAKDLGLAFQIVDDILEITGDQALLGKPVGSDAEKHKSTFVSLYGLDQARKTAEYYTKRAMETLQKLPLPDEFLMQLTDMLLNRLQ